MTEPTLADWLLQQIAADEQEARYSDSVEAGDPLDSEIGLDVDGRSLLVDGTRLLAECKAKRRIVEQYVAAVAAAEDVRDLFGGDDSPRAKVERASYDARASVWYETVSLLATAYADRDGYRAEWRVDG